MTCIIGLVDHGKVYIGGDSAAMNGWTRSTIVERKVQRLGEFLIGCAGVPRLGQLIGRHYDIHPTDLNDMTGFEVMVNLFVPSLQKWIEQAKFNWFTEDSESSAMLVGVRGQLFSICNDLSVNTHSSGFYAMGSKDLALGAMAALDGMQPEARILKALDICGQFSGAVCGPYYVEKI